MDSNIVLAVVRDIYTKQKAPVEVWKIYAMLRKFKPRTIREMIKTLHDNGRIMIDVGSMAVTPVITEEEKPYMEDRTNHISEAKIKEAIRSFFKEKMCYPSSSEIKVKVIEMFGVPEEKDVERFVRRLAEERRISRTDDYKYYLNNFSKEHSLMRY